MECRPMHVYLFVCLFVYLFIFMYYYCAVMSYLSVAYNKSWLSKYVHYSSLAS